MSKSFTKFVRPYIGRLAVSLVLSALSSIAALSAPIFVGNAVDYIIKQNDVNFAMVLHFAICAISAAAISMITQYLSSLITNSVAYGVTRDIRDAAAQKVNALPLRYIDSTSHGDIMTRLTSNVDTIGDGLIQGFTQLFSGIVTVVTTIIYMFILEWRIAAVVIVLTPVSLAVASAIARRTHNAFDGTSRAQGELGGLCEEMIGNADIVSAYGYGDRATERVAKINERIRHSGTRAVFYSALVNPTTRLINGFVYAAVALCGSLLVISSTGFTVGALSIFLSYANQYTKPFNEISGVMAELQSARSAMSRIDELLSAEQESSDCGLPQLTVKEGEVQMSHVDFAYDKARPLISDFNLTAHQGMKVAIVGKTGCGKTTLINLLMRFYDADSGVIKVDGNDVRGVTRDSLRTAYGMVLQETWLTGGTVRENIAFGKPSATDEEVISAACRASAHEFIMRLPQGYDTLLGDNVQLSGGQMQLICIARIMLTLPPMLILDEATSNIDTRSEMRIQAAFADLMEGRTTFVVAHRLSTIRNAELILVMRDGNIVEQGRHDSLMAAEGYYSELYRGIKDE